MDTNPPILMVIFCNTKAKATPTTSIMSQPAAMRAGCRHGIGNFGKEETMHALRITHKQLNIRSEGWRSAQLEHESELLGHCKNALMRKCVIVHPKQISKGDPDCPEEVKLAKQIKHLIRNEAALGDTEEALNSVEVKFGESGANPNPELPVA